MPKLFSVWGGDMGDEAEICVGSLVTFPGAQDIIWRVAKLTRIYPPLATLHPHIWSTRFTPAAQLEKSVWDLRIPTEMEVLAIASH